MENKLWDDCDIDGPCVCHPYAGSSDYEVKEGELVYCRSLEWGSVGAPEFDVRQKMWLDIDPNTPSEEINKYDLAVEFYDMQEVSDLERQENVL